MEIGLRLAVARSGRPLTPKLTVPKPGVRRYGDFVECLRAASQSPECNAASRHGMFSQRMDAVKRKVVMSRLTNPFVNLDFYQITNRARRLPAGAEVFTAFLKSYVASRRALLVSSRE
jgi:hypothetical protein